MQIVIDGEIRLEELICDGILLSTPARSTAYNLSAHGHILPIEAPLLALTQIFRRFVPTAGAGPSWATTP